MRQFESFALDTSNECLWKDGVQINLPPKPFAVLRFLVENPGRLITHDELLDNLWPETYVQPQVLRTYVLDLRKVLGDDAEHPRFIQTVPKRGYCFVAPVVNAADQKKLVTQRPPKSTSAHSGFVARETELGELRSCVQRAARSERQAVIITGSTGIGKTALVDAFCHELPGLLAANIARGQCIDGLGVREEFYPVTEALSQLCSGQDIGEVREVLSSIAPAFVPAKMRDLGAINALSSNGQRTVSNVCEALEEMAREKPMVLVFEDIQWADDSSIALISALARRRASAKLMVLATCRYRDISINHRLKLLIQDLRMRGLCCEIELKPLGKSDIRLLLAKELHQEKLPLELDSFVYQHSEGNPLFALALLEHLISQGCLERHAKDDAASRWEQRTPFPAIELGVPANLVQMISLEMERLSADQRRILECASLMRIVFPAWAVAAALETDALTTEAACEELAHELHFVHRAGYDDLPDGSRSAFFVFSHGLYREVLYQTQGEALRSVRHNRIADRLGELFAERKSSVGREMAMHYEAAGNWQKAVDSLRASARHAHARHAHSETVQLLEHAMRLAHNMNESDRALATHSIHNELKSAAAALRQFDRRQDHPEKLDELWTGT